VIYRDEIDSVCTVVDLAFNFHHVIVDFLGSYCPNIQEMADLKAVSSEEIAI
jgi:hypothetical protein